MTYGMWNMERANPKMGWIGAKACVCVCVE